MIAKIKSIPEITLKSLDLSGNELTTEIGDVLCNFIEEEKNIEFIGFSKNKLNHATFLEKLFNSIG